MTPDTTQPKPHPPPHQTLYWYPTACSVSPSLLLDFFLRQHLIHKSFYNLSSLRLAPTTLTPIRIRFPSLLNNHPSSRPRISLFLSSSSPQSFTLFLSLSLSYFSSPAAQSQIQHTPPPPALILDPFSLHRVYCASCSAFSIIFLDSAHQPLSSSKPPPFSFSLSLSIAQIHPVHLASIDTTTLTQSPTTNWQKRLASLRI